MDTATLITLAAALLCLAALWLQYGRAGLPLRSRAVLAGLRVLAIMVLLAAFYQPSLRISRLVRSGGRTAVLVDASASMVGLGADSLASSLWRAAAAPGRGARPAFYLFGDSLRRWNGRAEGPPHDRRSWFPQGPQAAALRSAARLVIVSDGVWSNAALPRELLEGRECWYVPMAAPSGATPELAAEPLAADLQSVLGGTALARVAVRGRSSRAAQVCATCVQDGVVAAQRQLRVAAGYFRDTLELSVPAQAAGRHLCRVSVTLDSVSSACSFIHTVVPGRFTAAVYAAAPLLDKRFFCLALEQDSSLRRVAPDSAAAADLLVLFDWDSRAAALMRGLRRTGVALFAGCLPCPAAAQLPVERYVVVSRVERAALALAAGDLPPLAMTLRWKDDPTALPLAGSQALMLLASTTDRGDTLPLLSTAQAGGRSAILMAGRGFWRWDFWTQLLPAQRPGDYPFSRYLIGLARERLAANLSTRLLAYPEGVPLGEGRESGLVLCLPSGLDWSTPAAVACTLAERLGRPVYDTSFFYDGLAPLHRVEVVLPAQPAGQYVYRVSMRHAGRLQRFVDTLSVEPDRSERGVAGQNSQLLSQFARPLRLDDTAGLRQVLAGAAAPQERVEVSALRLEQRWWMLLLLLALLCAEWVLRRRLRLE